MIIKFSPQRRDDTLKVTKKGDVLTINGQVYDLSVIPEGATLPAGATDCEFIVGDIHRTNGDIIITLLLPNTADATDAQRFPQDITMNGNGTVKLP